MFTKNTIKTIFSVRLLALSLLLSGASIALSENLLAVLDLENNGTISPKNIGTISDKISASIKNDTNYLQFDRRQIPELLKQLSIDQSATACSDPQCLTVIGSLIGANTMIGGTIRYAAKTTTIELNLVDVAAKKALNTVHLNSKSNKRDILEIEIPELVKNLFSAEPQKQPKQEIVRKKTLLANPLLYVGTLVVGGAAAGAYYYKYYYNPAATRSPDNPELPMGDAPERSR